MERTIFKLSLLATLTWLTCAAEPRNAFGQEAVEQDPADSGPSMIEIAHYVRGSSSDQYLCKGDSLILQVDSRAAVDVFVYVVYHDADGDRILLFPNPWERDNRIAVSRRRQIPGQKSGIEFCIRPPFGQESLQIIASARPLPELEVQVAERPGPLPVLPPADLDEWIKVWVADPSIEIHLSEFQTRPSADDEDLHAGPELVQ